MPTSLHTRDLILRLKQIKAEQELSPQRIYELIEQAGHHVSLTSIKKLFAEGSEDQHFRYQDTIQPVAEALLRLSGEESGNSEIDGLKAAIKVKNELIEKLQRELSARDVDARVKIEFLKDQLAKKDERIDRLMSRVDALMAREDTMLQSILAAVKNGSV